MSTRGTSLKDPFGRFQAGPRITCSGHGDVLGAWFFAIMLGGAVWLLFPHLEDYVLAGGVMLWLWLIGHRKAPPLAFRVLFPLIGSLMVLPVLWLPFSLRVFVTSESIIIRRRWLGIPVSGRRLNAQDIRALATNAGMQTRTGTGHHRVRYHLLAQTHDGRKVRCGAGLAGQSAIRLYEARFRQALGMQAV